LYHAPVHLQKSDFTPPAIVIALEPPGNIAAEIARYRSRLFSALAEPSARAFPELLPLMTVRAVPTDPPPSGRLRRKELHRLEAARERTLARAWSGAEGGFSSGPPAIIGGRLYLTIEGPFDALASSLAGLLPSLGLEPAAGAVSPIAPRSGFFLCAPRDGAAALAAAESLGPPEFSFMACRIALVSVFYGHDAFSTLVWEELYGAWRPRAKSP
jgi:hypothetical protein